MKANENRLFLLLLLFAASILLWNVGSYGVVETSDARYAEIGREMFLNGDWLHPSLLQIHHYHKPPLTYQITALGYSLFGITPFGARFFLQIALLLQLLLVYLWAKDLLQDRRSALVASAVYFSFPLVLASSRTLTTDAYLTTFALLAIFAWTRYRIRGTALWLYLGALALGLGFLTKGPLVLIPFVLYWLFFRKRLPRQNPSRGSILAAWSLFVLLSASWYLYLAWENPAFWSYFVERQTVERFSSNVFHRHEPFWYYWLLTPLLGLPWLAALPWMLLKERSVFRSGSLERALVGILLLTWIFFSISSSKRIFYVLPYFGFFAVLIASLLQKISNDQIQKIARAFGIYAFTLAAALCLAPFFPLKISLPWNIGIYGFFALLLLGALFVSKRFDALMRALLAAWIASALLLLSASELMAQRPELFKIARPAAAWIRTQHLQNRLILVYDRRLPSLAFELDRPIVSLYDGDRSLNRETQFETDNGWKASLYNLKSPEEVHRLRARLRHHPSLLVIYRKKLSANARWLEKLFSHHEVMGKWSIYY